MEKIYTKLKMILLTGTFLMFTVIAFAQLDFTIASGETHIIGPTGLETYTTLTNNGTLTIESDATGTGSLIVASTSGSGTVNVERYLPSSNWHIVSLMVAGETVGGFFGRNTIATTTTPAPENRQVYAIALYDTDANGWFYTDASMNALPAERGFAYSVKRTNASGSGALTVSGNSIYTGDFTVDTENTGSQWGSVGNPYTSAIWVKGAISPAEDFLTINGSNLEPQYVGLYVWDQSLNGGDYTVITKELYDFPNGEGGNFDKLDQTKIAVGQGFIIKAAATSVSFKATMQVHATATPFKSAEKLTSAVRLTVTSGDLVNRAIVAFGKESTLGLDPGYDVGKFKGNPNLSLYTKLVDGSSDVDFINQSVPDANYELLTIPVGLDLANAGEITFSLETSNGFPSNMKVYLEDKVLNTTTQLDKKGAIYSASVSSMKGYGRFNLHFSNSTTGIDLEKQNQANFNVFSNDRLIFVNGPADKNTYLSVYGIDGKMWYQNRAEATNRNTIDASGFAAGVYLVKIDKVGSSQTVKVVLTN